MKAKDRENHLNMATSRTVGPRVSNSIRKNATRETKKEQRLGASGRAALHALCHDPPRNMYIITSRCIICRGVRTRGFLQL